MTTRSTSPRRAREHRAVQAGERHGPPQGSAVASGPRCGQERMLCTWPRPGMAGPLLGSARSGGRVPTLARSFAMAPRRQYRVAGGDTADVGDTATAIDEPRAPTLGARLDGARLSSILATRRERAEQDYAQREREAPRRVAPRASVDHGVLNTLVDGVRQVDRVETQRRSWSPIHPELVRVSSTHFTITPVLTLPLTTHDAPRRAQAPRSPLDPQLRVVRAAIARPAATWRA